MSMYDSFIYHLSFRLKDKGRSIKEIIDILEVKRSTLYHWFRHDKKEYHQYSRPTSKQNIQQEVLNIVEQYPSDSLRKITFKVNLLLNKPVSLWTVFRTIKSTIGFTHKKVYKIGTSKDMRYITLLRTQFSQQFSNIPIDKLLCLDETSVYDLASANKAWTPKGQRFHAPMPYTSKTCTRCLALKSNLGARKVFECTHCGFVGDRDVCGARNILMLNRDLFIWGTQGSSSHEVGV